MKMSIPRNDGTIVEIAADVTTILRYNQNIMKIFPEDTNETVTLVTPAGANTWGAWAEVDDNNGVTFSSKLDAVSQFLSTIVVETVSVNNQRFMFEFAYGDDKIVVTRLRVYSGAVPKQETSVKALVIPFGETVYYRGKCSLAGPQNCTVHFRYHPLD